MHQTITVVLRDGRKIIAHGDVIHDEANSLIVSGDPGTYMNFNWDFVAYYVVSPYEENADV
ncbi:hypothetical protein BST33_00140 [Mycolicibacter minnesotensis]|uniref:Uncharacterized protein n=1 Tax=Mycolicibacter minnesotensis TaxID=1118379 RepID=A0A7I7RA48_9MYCO|nr:hypothetical protein [Mycolicibacter minnesotensis]ORB04353.1 hypothetical protein BST33_00140 [Mycolicibacter minnesotensis]BBY34926.1 hypothetical protein MMIN_29870 [Mycolicibacter minnesotensis]